MKKILTISFKTFLLSIILQASLMAQPRLAATANGSGTQKNNTLNLFIEVELTNLNVYLPAAINGTEFFPTGHPAMFLEINSGYDVKTYPLILFKESGVFTYSNPRGNSTGIVYVTSVVHNVDLGRLCDGDGDGESRAPGNTSNLNTYPIEMRLVTETGELYPACDYTNAYDIFSCDYFGAVDCNDPQTCINEELTTGTAYLDVNCGNLPGSDTRSRKDALTKELNIYPNPANSQLNLMIPDNFENGSGSLVISNSQGRTMITRNGLSGGQLLILDLEELQSDIYFVHLYDKAIQYNKKFIKL